MLEKNGVVNLEILNEVADISFQNNHGNSLQSSFKDQFDSTQEELLFGNPSNGKKMTEYIEGSHVFYDLVAEYMDKFFRWGSWLCVCNKGQIFHHNLLLFCSYVLILIKREEEMELLHKFDKNLSVNYNINLYYFQ